MSWDEFFN